MASTFHPLPPLPMNLPSTGFATTSHDIEYQQIVQSVKLLYLRRLYKQCANLCKKHLTEQGIKVIRTRKSIAIFLLTFDSSILSIRCFLTSLPALHMIPKHEACRVGHRYYLELSPMPSNFSFEHNKFYLLLFHETISRLFNQSRSMKRAKPTTIRLAIP